MSGKRLIAIVGPTASGKSKLALFVAKNTGGEIVNGDSRQVYRYMDIGTAKPYGDDRAAVPHHLYDISDPDKQVNLAEYQESAFRIIEDIFQRGSIPVLVGGSGLYIWSVLEGWEIPRIEPDMELRKKLEERASLEEEGSLYQELQELDPYAAKRIDPRNLRRVIRALEICYKQGCSGGPHKKKSPSFLSLIIGLRTERKELYSRIDRRVDEMISKGLIEEVKGILARGYSERLSALSSAVGYKEIIRYLKKELSLEEAISRIKFETHRLARKQFGWFKEKDERINWLNIDDVLEERALNLVNGWLAA